MGRRIVLSTAGTAGDLNPFIAIALELRARGHRPVIATQREFQPAIEAEGLAFHLVRPGVDDVRRELGLDAPEIVQRATHGSSGLEFAVRRIAMPFLRRAFDDMMAATVDADLVVTHTSAFAARLAAEKRGLPWLSTALAPFTFMSVYDPPILSTLPPLKTLRRMTGARSDAALARVVRLATASWTGKFQQMRTRLGLPRSANPLFEGQFSPFGTLALYSPLFGSLQPDFPPDCAMTGFCFYDRRAGAAERLPEALAAFLDSGPPPLVFTLGSALTLEPGRFYDVAIKAARQLGRRAVLLVGPDAARRLPRSEDVLITEYAPHSLLFPRACAVVHHGGVGTTAQALRAGKPQLVVPFFADQPDNAARVVRLGAGRSLADRAWRPGAATRELGALLNGAYGPRTEDLSRRLSREHGAVAAADRIEELMSGPGLRLTA
ncbi:glycosyltransferase [Phenylobacterium aquaticum]|uniref:glycosyltransferase n=1 Tax=Phenylobacterium aquaticum TaxID=1763816 RepID=UPI001F5C3053|nr:glycosyltransferase [Phenylobacterium aquaticum]MCI3134178.1 glycosyltransferase [Phenylobacterium aquaticum]